MTSRIAALHARLRSFLEPAFRGVARLAVPETSRIGPIIRSSPSELHGAARASFVREAIVDYHQGLIADRPSSVQEKFEKMAESPFAFFRGTADLFYRDLAGKDANLPTVLANGDVHPENFSVIEGGDRKLFFGLDDFDEAHPAPFTWDLRRGVTGLELAMRERGFSDEMREAARSAFLSGYFDALRSFARSGREKKIRLTAENAPEPVKSLLIEAAGKERAKFLDKLAEGGRFRETDELAPIPDRVPEFQTAVDGYRDTLGPFAPRSARHFRVKAAAVKSGSGLGSIGLRRYFALLEGKSRRGEDDVVLELKEERPSAIAPHVSQTALRFRSEGARVAAAEQVQQVQGDRYYGEATIEGQSYLVREKNPHKLKLDLDDLGFEDFAAYAGVMGRVVAQAHARADADTGIARGQIESRILRSASIDRLSSEISAYGVEAADRATADQAAFAEMIESGALASAFGVA